MVKEQEVITLDDDDDETLVKKEPETLSLTPNTTPLCRNATPSEGVLIKSEPECGGVKRVNSRPETDAPPPKRFEANVFSFTNSREDAEAVDIICSNFIDFSTLCISKGFKLAVEALPDTSVNIKLTQTAADAPYRKAFLELDALIKSKREKHDLNSTLVEITKQLDDYKGKVDLLVAERNQQPPPTPQRFQPPVQNSIPPTPLAYQPPVQNYIPPTPQTYQPPVQNYSRPIPTHRVPIPPPIPQVRRPPSEHHSSSSEDSDFDKRKSFLSSTRLNCILDNDELIKRISMKLSSKTRGPTSPFYRCWPNDKKEIVINYLKSLQQDIQGQKDKEHNAKLSKLLNERWKEYLFTPSSQCLRRQSREMRRKFQLKEYVVGTIHFLQFSENPESTFFLCMAIVDQRIVAWRVKPTMDNALLKIRKSLSGKDIKWDTKYKFVTNLTIQSNYRDLFVHSNRREIFTANQKVVTWMKNNFRCLATCIENDNEAAFPAIYNMAVTFVEDFRE